MSNVHEKYDLECREIFLKFKTLLFAATSISETNKLASSQDLRIHEQFVDKIQVELQQKLIQYSSEFWDKLKEQQNYYLIQYVTLIDFPNPKRS